MRKYHKPMFTTEEFDVEDIITASSGLPGVDSSEAGSENQSGPDFSESVTETVTVSTTLPELEEDVFLPVGAGFVEALNSLYDNFLSHF